MSGLLKKRKITMREDKNNVMSLVASNDKKKENDDTSLPTLAELSERLEEHGPVEEIVIVALGKDGDMRIVSNLQGASFVNMLLDSAKLSLLTGGIGE